MDPETRSKKERDAMAFRDVLVKLRKQRGWSQQDLSNTAKIHVQVIKRYEAGLSLPTLDSLASLARSLGVSADILVFDEPNGIAGDVLDDAELLELFRKLTRLRAQEREAVRVLLRALIERQPDAEPASSESQLAPEAAQGTPRRRRTSRQAP
jgi:transcriptional regulator with XRE-family HTH domain